MADAVRIQPDLDFVRSIQESGGHRGRGGEHQIPSAPLAAVAAAHPKAAVFPGYGFDLLAGLQCRAQPFGDGLHDILDAARRSKP